jgi:Zn-dependent membrane protease YugP
MFMMDWQHLLYVALPTMALLGLAQIWVSMTYGKYSKIRNQKGITGAEAAVVVLREAGITDVRVERSDGFLTDHYSPMEKVIRLSSTNYDQSTIAAVGVAAHEAGHAIQHAQHFFPVHLRTLAVPLASGAQLGYLAIFIGFFLMGKTLNPVTLIGLLLIAGVAVFQLINLPVELDASRRALLVLPRIGILTEEETVGARKVLTAAAMTYFAATIAALWELFFWLVRLGIIGGRSDD